MKYELEILKDFVKECGIPTKGSVKSGFGHMALKETPMVKFESRYYDDVRKALANTLAKKSDINIFFKGISMMDSLKGNSPKGKYFTLCVQRRDDQKMSQTLFANFSSIGL